MPQLLTLPLAVPLSSAGLLLPGAKLSFFVTATSTPQPVYRDIGLITAHTQPVEANGAGVFDPIYLDPSLPNYRILLTDSANVTLPGYPIDNVPSNQNTSQKFRLVHTAPEILFHETDASAGNQKSRIRVNAEKILVELLSDDEGTFALIFELTRAGLTPGSLNFAGQFLRVNGDLTSTQSSSAVTATLTGVNALVTGTVNIRRTGTKLAIYVPTTIQGTSDSTSMSLTNLGTLCLSNGGVILTTVKDNGSIVLGTAFLGVSSISFGVGAAGGNFTGSGTKGIQGGTLLMFDTDLVGVA